MEISKDEKQEKDSFHESQEFKKKMAAAIKLHIELEGLWRIYTHRAVTPEKFLEISDEYINDYRTNH